MGYRATGTGLRGETTASVVTFLGSEGACIGVRATAATVPGSGLMDIEALARRLGISVRYARRLVAERRIPYVKFGHLLRFDPVDIDEWLEQAKVPALWSPRQ